MNLNDIKMCYSLISNFSPNDQKGFNKYKIEDLNDNMKNVKEPGWE